MSFLQVSKRVWVVVWEAVIKKAELQICAHILQVHTNYHV